VEKPELYTIGRYDRRPIRHDRSAIWNKLYYRRKGKRFRYVDQTRWQLDYDLVKPWNAYCVHPPHRGEDQKVVSIGHEKDFRTFAEAVAWLNSYHLHDYEMERMIHG
jgi:hypothetical protein